MSCQFGFRRSSHNGHSSTTTIMNTEIDEDDFLYGEGTSQQAPQRPSSTTEQPKPDHPMEGEDEEEMSDDEEEEDSDSVRVFSSDKLT